MRSRVELVDQNGVGIGDASVDEVHRKPGRLHRAFSAVLHDGHGHVLFQRRSALKERWPGHLANSCCGHPDSKATLIDDCRQRIQEELLLDVSELVEVGTFIYTAEMPDSSWLEWEWDHVVVGQVDSNLAMSPNPAEVSETHWLSSIDAVGGGAEYAPWLFDVLRVAAPHVPKFSFFDAPPDETEKTKIRE